ncbi:TonB-dependent receptor [Asticcacaulis solisilvae]|uniref:TonB-dependent receptor n=1 Tax=Asticcacaulis solisilvae TaxID=1217274 RepID=UPI003FD78E16
MKSAHMISCAFAALATGLAFAPVAGQASAQDTKATKADDGAQEVIITAQRRSQSIQKVPMTVQAFTSTSLQQLNITTLDDLLKYTPNVEFPKNGPGQGNIYMRGLSAGFAGNQSQGTVGNFPNVAVYLDDQSMQFPSHNVDVYMVDMDRVEVLEGPQGTLFGGGAEAGALRYITNKPNLVSTLGKLDVSYGFQKGGDANTSASAVFNLPLIKDTFALRAVVYSDRQGGYIDNVQSTFTRGNFDDNGYFGVSPTNGICPNGQPAGHRPGGTALVSCTIGGTAVANNHDVAKDNWNPTTTDGARLSALYKINDDWDVLIAESLQSMDSEGLAVEYPTGSDGQTLKPLQITAFSPSYDKDKFQNTAWTVNGKLGALKLVYTGAFMRRNIEQQMDYTNYSRTLYGQYYECTGGNSGLIGSGKGYPITCYSPVTNWHDKIENTHQTHEFRVSTPDDWRLRFVAGAFYEQFIIKDVMDFNYKTIISCDDPGVLAAAIAGTGPLCVGNDATIPGTTASQPGVRNDNTGFGEDTKRGYSQGALFGSVDFDIIPHVLTATLGTRYYNYNEYEKGSVYHTAADCLNVLVCPAKHNIDADHDRVNYHGFKSHFGLQWTPAEHTLFYYTYSEGFRPGGFSRYPNTKANDANGIPQFISPIVYTPDSLVNNEIGMKKDFFDRKLQLNLTAYAMKWTNVQIALYQPCCLGNTTFLVNGPDYDINGFEAQFIARPWEGLTLQGSATYNDNTQSNSPCLIDNQDGSTGKTPSPNLGKCITQVKTANGLVPFTNPFGVQGGVSAFSPKVQANIRARYEWALADYRAFATGNISYTDKMYTQPANYTPGTSANENPVPDTTYTRWELPAYTTIGASFGVTRDNWTAEVVGTNLTNSHASTFTSTAQFIKSQVPLRPMTITFKLSAGF